jgi:hypothetical protein
VPKDLQKHLRGNAEQGDALVQNYQVNPAPLKSVG